MKYNQIESLVIQWADEKGILKKGNPTAQCEKTKEEVEELAEAILLNDREEIADALGDIMVTVIIQAHMQGMSLMECLEGAYEIISKRQGKMINGTFVKNS
jgi:NTP pyrophosphatase (non-canonical NTP hydrolase)